MLEKYCENGNFVVCTDLGTIYSSKRYVQKIDIEKAIKFYKKACNGEFYESCSNLGVIYLRGDGVKKDAQKALKLFKKACDGKNFAGCGKIGGYYYEIGNIQKTKEYFKKACKLQGANQVSISYCDLYRMVEATYKQKIIL